MNLAVEREDVQVLARLSGERIVRAEAEKHTIPFRVFLWPPDPSSAGTLYASQIVSPGVCHCLGRCISVDLWSEAGRWILRILPFM